MTFVIDSYVIWYRFYECYVTFVFVCTRVKEAKDKFAY